jgi:very-short-patch-repair endonuclease
MKRELAELGETGGVILRREAIAMGLNDRAIARLVGDGTWCKVRRGAYVDKEFWDGLDPLDQHRVLARAVLRTAECPAVLSHLSAAIEHGAEVWDLDLSVVHITRLDGRAGRREAGVEQHRGVLTDDEIQHHDGIAVVSPARSIVEVNTQCNVEHSLVVTNSLLHLGRTTLGLVGFEAMKCDRWPNTLTMRIVHGLADPRIESVGETRTAHVIWSQRLPRFVPQFKIRDHNGHVVARVDFAAPELRVFLEFDGRGKYLRNTRGMSADEVLLEERRREALICSLTGWICVRITWADLKDPERLARRIRVAINSRRTTAG